MDLATNIELRKRSLLPAVLWMAVAASIMLAQAPSAPQSPPPAAPTATAPEAPEAPDEPAPDPAEPAVV